jgi:hypothetical protein
MALSEIHAGIRAARTRVPLLDNALVELTGRRNDGQQVASAIGRLTYPPEMFVKARANPAYHANYVTDTVGDLAWLARTVSRAIRPGS